jgi:hypothetical protein
MNMPIFNFHKMIDMHKGYAYQFLILLPTKKLQFFFKNLVNYTPRTKPKLAGN